MAPAHADDVLHAAHEQLRHSRTIDVELASVGDLLDDDVLGGSGLERLVGVLESAVRLPTSLNVRVAVSAPDPAHDSSEVEALRARCRSESDAAWREAMTLRAGGLRELPRALLIAVVLASVGGGCGYLAQNVDRSFLTVVLYGLAFLAVIGAWTIGWTTIEQALYDWRAPRHTAAVYDLLCHASVEVVPQAPAGTRHPAPTTTLPD
jgi:hypothetical protein